MNKDIKITKILCKSTKKTKTKSLRSIFFKFFSFWNGLYPNRFDKFDINKDFTKMNLDFLFNLELILHPNEF